MQRNGWFKEKSVRVCTHIDGCLGWRAGSALPLLDLPVTELIDSIIYSIRTVRLLVCSSFHVKGIQAKSSSISLRIESKHIIPQFKGTVLEDEEEDGNQSLVSAASILSVAYTK